jgi:hypothetical protein
VQGGVGGGEEGRAEAEGDRAADGHQRQVEQVGHRGQPLAEQPARALDLLGRRVLRGAAEPAPIAVPLISASRQPRDPHGQARPAGTTTT